ncbi:MAG: hypothetical protein ONB46_08965 [candidate division KSB1 bacterium]|nr:hypothetical protein [candidate division KSB1 bacterium]MDZ7365845.1 hypothetical protein [candidate division KSB1 bacterium]MDZ7403920.1 hypothetical protein [candidate division KSB1 bacterium]
MILIKGVIRNRKPIVSVTIDQQGNLNFSSAGEYRFVVDTGFTGYIVVPYALLPKLNLKFLNFTHFTLATHRNIQLPVFKGWVKVRTKRVKVEIVPGDELIGMKFLERVGSKLIVDFTKAEVKLLG